MSFFCPSHSSSCLLPSFWSGAVAQTFLVFDGFGSFEEYGSDIW